MLWKNLAIAARVLPSCASHGDQGLGRSKSCLHSGVFGASSVDAGEPHVVELFLPFYK